MEKSSFKWPLISSLVLLIFFSYANQLLYRYQVPAGGDAINHNLFVQTILDGKYTEVLDYHAIWHLITAALSALFHVPSLTIMAWLAPGLLVAMGLALYFFNRKFVSETAGIASLILIGFFSQQPIQTLYDGGFPNVLAAGTVLPIVFIAFHNVIQKKRKGASLPLFFLSLLLLAYSHHLTTLYALPTLALAGVGYLIGYARSKQVPALTILLLMIIVTFIAFGGFYWLLNSQIESSVLSLARQFMKPDTIFPFFHFQGKLDNPNAIWPLSVYPNGIGEAVVYLGMGGFLIACYRLITGRGSKEWDGYLILIAWTTTLFVLSRIPSLAFPVRLARDMAIPLALLGGIFIHSVLAFIYYRRLPRLFAYLFIFACILLGWLTFADRYVRATQPNKLITHLAVDTQAAHYITEQLPLAAKILVPQSDIYLQNFTPLHHLHYASSEAVAITFLDDKLSYDEISDYDYIYIEERRDIPQNWSNNDGIIRTYSQSSDVELVATFEQREKKVSLFKVKHPKELLKKSSLTE